MRGGESPSAAQPAPSSCDADADPSTLAQRLSAAAPGQTICLASGRYGRFPGAAMPGRVTLRARERAGPHMRILFSDAVDLTLDGMTIAGAELTGSTRDITIRNSAFTAPVTIDGLENANVLLERNTHLDIDAPGDASPARIHLRYSSSQPSGVTVRDSLLAGGDADGIQTGAGMAIVGNEFRHILQHGPNHTDAIQLLGAPGTLVRGNYIHDSSSGIVAYDGLAGAVIEDNVIDLADRRWGIELYSDEGSTVRHNTLPYRPCADDGCGWIDITRKPALPAGAATVVVDNVATGISIANGSTLAAHHHNLVRGRAKSADSVGVPAFVGGRTPADYRGFRLVAGSPGTGAASDGRDAGIGR